MKTRARQIKTGRKENTPKAAAAGAALPPGLKWRFRIFAFLAVPLVLLGGVELILRLAGYGYATGFFEKIRADHREFLVNNEDFSRRFFPSQLMRWPGPLMFAAKKPANTYRIFILGESAARGEPEPACAASRYLEALLDERFPGTHFEVINLGITAIDSHVILPIARDCAGAEGDLWIIYMGNNEMVGPFGAATVFGAKAPSAGLVRLNLALKKLRLGQLVIDLQRRLANNNANASWGGMKMFLGNQLPADDPRKEVVYRNFDRNLDDIVRLGLHSGVNILLNTVAVNLKDCPPFASLGNSNLPATDAARFESLYAEGCRAQEQTDFAGAAQKFDAAAKLDAQFANLQFRWSECLAATGNMSAARDHYQQACDDDALPFRADSRINGIIAAAGKKYAENKLVFFDAAAALAAQTTNGICGQETFFEHVHFNFDGNFRLGCAWARQVEALLPRGILQTATTNGWANRETCERRLGLMDANRCAVLTTMIDRLGRPPFNSQPNNRERLRAMREEARALASRMSAVSAPTAIETYSAAIQRAPGDFLLHKNFAEYLESMKALGQAAAEWKQVCELLPHSCEGFYQAGRLLNQLGQWDEAEKSLNRAVSLRPQLAEAWFELGTGCFDRGKFEMALHHFEHARRLDPSVANYCALEGRTFSKLGRPHDAIECYRQTLQIQPEFRNVWLAMGDELVVINQIAPAKEAYAEAVRLKPDDALAHLDLGVMLARLRQFDDAGVQFGETLRLEPGNQPAREYLNQVQALKQPHAADLK